MQQDETSPNVDRYEISIVDREAAGLNADFEPTIRNIVGVRDKEQDKTSLVVIYRFDIALTGVSECARSLGVPGGYTRSNFLPTSACRRSAYSTEAGH